MNIPQNIEQLFIDAIQNISKSYVPLRTTLFYGSDNRVCNSAISIPDNVLYVTGEEINQYINFFQTEVHPVDLDVYSVTTEQLEEMGYNYLSLDLIQKINLSFTLSVNDIKH
mgnify:FL=1